MSVVASRDAVVVERVGYMGLGIVKITRKINGKDVTKDGVRFTGEASDIVFPMGDRTYFATPATDRYAGVNVGYASTSNGFPRMVNLPNIEHARALLAVLSAAIESAEMFAERQTVSGGNVNVTGSARVLSADGTVTPANVKRQRTRAK